MAKRNIIVMDSDAFEGRDFKEAVEQVTGQKWDIMVRHCNVPQNAFENLMRYLKYIFVPLDICIHRKQYENIIMWQQFFGIFYAFWCGLFRVKKCNHVVVMMLIYKEKRGIAGKLYRWLYNYALHSHYIKVFTCGARIERKQYLSLFQLPAKRIAYIPWGITDYAKTYTTVPSEEKYILSAGRSNRDWGFLVNALGDTDYKVKIVNSESLDLLPANFTQYTNVPRERYYDLLAKAYCVVISVDDPTISSGQLALIEALQFQKPVIATRSDGLTKDYIISGQNGIEIEKDKTQLVTALKELYEDQEKYESIQRQGRRYYTEKLSSYRMGKDIGRLLVK